MQFKFKGYARTLAIVGVLVALAVVVRNFSLMIPIAGVSALRISFAEVFTRMAAIMFGPFYGGISSGALDVIAFFLSGGAYGPFIPWITINAVLGGVMTGLIWTRVGRMDAARARNIYMVVLAVTCGTGGLLQIILSLLPNSGLADLLLQFKDTKGNSVIPVISAVLLIAAAIGAFLYIVNALLKKQNRKLRIDDDFMRVLFAVGIPGLIVSTLDSAALAATYGTPFLVFWVPRIAQQAVMVIVHSYMATCLLAAYRRLQTRTAA
jgi:ECF transporter S component (folate family)